MKTKTDVFNKKCVTALILTLIIFVCSLAPIFSASSVKAEDGPILSERPQYMFHPSFVRTNGSVLGIWNQPYMAGYMTNDSLSGNPGYLYADAVSVTVSFSGTDNSIIQDGNALAAGIAAQGPSSSGQIFLPEPWIDYGYTMLLVVDNLYDWPFIQVVVWEVLEWGPNNLWPFEDPVANPVDGCIWENPQVLTIDSEVTLTMEWSSNLLFCSATIEGVEYPVHIHYPNDIQHDCFMLGTVEREHDLEPFVDLSGTVKWFQFPGAWSNINIGQVGWHSYLSYPSYKMNGESSWTNVPFAYSVNGTTSWLDNTVNWGGLCYDNVQADYTYQHVHFYPAGSTLEPDTLLWNPPLSTLTVTSDGSGTVRKIETKVVTISQISNNGWVCGWNEVYETARSVPTGFQLGDGYYVAVGQDYDANLFFVQRAFLKFDTSIIPYDASLISAELHLYSEGWLDVGITNWNLIIQKWTDDTPINTDDYNKFDGVNYGSFPTVSWKEVSWNTIMIQNLDLIQKASTTKICLRSSRDISATTPMGLEGCDFHGKYPTLEYMPYLVIRYLGEEVEDSKEYLYGSTVNLIAVPSSGHAAFDYWLLDGATVYDNPITVTMDSDHTLEACFVPEPVCAMKTRTDGYFYIPSIASGLLEILILFDDSNVTGDQRGYEIGEIFQLPDSLVNMYDLTFVTGKYELFEGEDGWDYMADVRPDGEINIYDVCTVTANYDRSGTYSDVLAGVTITFDTGEEMAESGFVTIPEDATNFTVKRYDTPIGAMIIFYDTG